MLSVYRSCLPRAAPWRGSIVVLLFSLTAAGCFSEPDQPEGDDTRRPPSEPGSSTNTSSTGGDGDSTSAEDPQAPETSGQETTDATTWAASSGEASTDCGNAFVDEAEECDDANEDDLDGCLRTCALGPTTITATVEGEPATIDTIEDPDARFRFDCGGRGPGAVTGIDGLLGGPAKGAGWPVSIGATCRHIGLIQGADGIAVGLTATSFYQPVGFPTGTQGPYGLECPAGEVMVGLRAQLIENDVKTYLTRLVASCAPLVLVESEGKYSIAIGRETENGPIGDARGLPAHPAACPPGTVVSGISGAAADSIDALAVECVSLSVE